MIVGAQTLLARAGYYRSGIDGEFGPGTIAAFALSNGGPLSRWTGDLTWRPSPRSASFPASTGRGSSGAGRFRHQPVYRGQWIPE